MADNQKDETTDSPEELPEPAQPRLDSGVIFLAESQMEAAEQEFLRRQNLAHVADGQFEGVGIQSDDGAGETGPPGGAAGLDLAAGDGRSTVESSLDSSPGSGRDPSNQADPADSPQNEVSLTRSLIEWLMVLVGAVVVALVIRSYLFKAFSIPSGSMEATLQVDDRVMVNRLSYRLHDVNRGDIVVFDKPVGLLSSNSHLIKRVIGLEGDVIEGRDNGVYINGQRLTEPYLDPADTIRNFGPVTIPADHVFVMGDNRDDSSDSRVFGPILMDTIVGRAFVIYWPTSRLDGI